MMEQPEFDSIKQPNKMSSYWKRQWKVILCVTVFGVGFNAAMPYAAILQGRLIDAIVTKQTVASVMRWIGLFVAAVALIQLMRYLKRYYVRLFANRTMLDMRLLLFHQMMSQDLAAKSPGHTGDTMVKAVSDVDICVEGMRKVTTEIFDTGVLMLSYMTTMILYDGKIALLACGCIPVAMVLAEYLKGRIVHHVKSARTQTSVVADMTYTNMEQIALQRIHGLEEKRHEAYVQALDELEKKSVKAGILEGAMQPLYQAIAMVGIAPVLYLGGENVINGIWTISTFSACVTIFIALSAKAGKAAKLFNSYQKAAVSWQRIRPYFRPYQKWDTQDTASEAKKTELRVVGLTVTHAGTQDPVLKNLSFTAREGELVGVTGPVACGKSSLGLTLSGCYPYRGVIQLDGKEWRDYSPYQRSKRVSVMFHEPQLLSDSIYNNITLGEGGDISRVLEDVCFQEDLQSMAEGIHTMVGSGGMRLSGGQQGRIALARALYRHSKLIVLDDPFSAVDRNTERNIIQNLRRNYQQSIIVLISHRLAVFPLVDHILLLEANREWNWGDHHTLLQQSATYRELYTLQQGEVGVTGEE